MRTIRANLKHWIPAERTLVPERLTASYRVVPWVTQPGAPLHTRATFVVENGRPGAQPG